MDLNSMIYLAQNQAYNALRPVYHRKIDWAKQAEYFDSLIKDKMIEAYRLGRLDEAAHRPEPGQEIAA